MASNPTLQKMVAAETRMTGKRFCHGCQIHRPVEIFSVTPAKRTSWRCDPCRAKAAERRRT